MTAVLLSPDTVLALFQQAWQDRDADALAALFREDAEFVNVVGLWWHRREDIAVAHRYGFDTIFGDSELRFVEERIRQWPGSAVVHGRWLIDGQIQPDGAPAGPREGIFVFVLAEHDGRWWVEAAQNTDVIAGVESIAVVDGVSRPVDYR